MPVWVLNAAQMVHIHRHEGMRSPNPQQICFKFCIPLSDDAWKAPAGRRCMICSRKNRACQSQGRALVRKPWATHTERERERTSKEGMLPMQKHPEEISGRSSKAIP